MLIDALSPTAQIERQGASFLEEVMSAGRNLAFAVAAGLALAGAGQTFSAEAKAPAVYSPCFFVTQWGGWKAPDENTLYLGVNMHDVYKVDLSAGSPMLMWPDAHLVSIVRGSSSICTALDLDLKVADSNGFPEGLIAKSMRKLSKDEVAAIPKKYRPN